MGSVDEMLRTYLCLNTIPIGFRSLTYPHLCTLCMANWVSGNQNYWDRSWISVISFQVSLCYSLICDTIIFFFSWKFTSQYKQNFNLVLQVCIAAHLYSSIFLLSLSSTIHRRFWQLMLRVKCKVFGYFWNCTIMNSVL